jgi:hypothetical protein
MLLTDILSIGFQISRHLLHHAAADRIIVSVEELIARA